VREWDKLISLFEEISSSVSSSKVFWRLLRNGEMNISEIIRQTGLNHKIVRRSLEWMMSNGLVKDKSFGRLRIYFLNEDEPRIRALLNFVKQVPCEPPQE
jgi:predicted transcriptional regulator